MSAGRVCEGAGWFSWWGFSPARNLLSLGEKLQMNVLLVGSGDPRHILKTMADSPVEENLHMWVIESSMDVVARQLLLLYFIILLKPRRSKMFCFQRRLKFSWSFLETQKSGVRQKRRCERDELARILKLWIQPAGSSPVIMSKAWDYRVRQHLGTRYDSKKGCFDWDLTMKLHEKGCGVISKQQYVQWRGKGLAFEMREGIYQTTNPTLLSTRVFNKKGDKVGIQGYWGDIVSSPYLSFGIESDDKKLLKTQNGQNLHTAQDISFANLQELFRCLSSRRRYLSTSHSDTEAEEAPTLSQQKSLNDLMHLSGVSVTFLPLDSLQKLPQKQKYRHYFNSIYFSASCVHQLDPMMGQIAAPDAVLVVELAKYILDLNKEQEAGFAETVANLALQAGFEPWCEGASDGASDGSSDGTSDGGSDGIHAVFIQQK
uniref:Dynein axonemal assembly factor 3 n=1 Tax=Xiphophorus couchianus TaxID=32473 RepID=A0A3B5KUW5_9TELE